MRFLFKLVLVVAVLFILHYYFGSEMDSFVEQMKSKIHHWITPPSSQQHETSEGDRRYYPIEKRVQ